MSFDSNAISVFPYDFRILYEHLTNMLHVYKHINTQKSPTCNSNVHFLVLFLGFSIQKKFVIDTKGPSYESL
jgi:hypothetical protein